ncbi:histidine kinase dimerization/phospho-acceptor domain-containing protein [Comamonas endophytica]|uniref:histidine kinase n=1 Tax=Comamonas endophytica TaxID=2949090 RepID=A0ABY6GFH3_9BURK|nr:MULTISPECIES: histidine kinase dimerization/phospho-acceptor domain-containing protein [unclassified Acidovorax]MCD2513368.1 sensor histidine kinase N-terminal domain-containing protein [Acidovorax sp. D4N7]UYG53849.1 sensor histidine kinase N-terminal domain-containing protein [Acidovorax sp. 5MLIR]
MKYRPSLQRELLAWTLGGLVAVWLAFIYFGYLTGEHEADELTDGHLASVASLLLAQRAEAFSSRPDAAALSSPGLKAHDYQHSMSVVIWDGNGRVLARTGEAPMPDFQLADGFQTVELGPQRQPWRLFVRWNEGERARRVAVLLSIEERDALATDIAEQVATPGLWLLPVVALVLVLAVRRGLRPLNRLSEQVRSLEVGQAFELQAPPHEEFQAMVKAIETLSSRYTSALHRERALANEFAHELRTPLASLQLQVELLKTAEPGALPAIVQQLDKDAQRSAAVIHHLLALARASRTQLAEAAASFDLADLVRKIAADYGEKAYKSRHELCVSAPDTVLLRGYGTLLEIAIRNLIENSLAHTPAGTLVEVRVEADPVSVEVRDTPQAGLQAAPAQGILGLGLGHQVVQKVAAIHGADFVKTSHADGAVAGYRMGPLRDIGQGG